MYEDEACMDVLFLMAAAFVGGVAATVVVAFAIGAEAESNVREIEVSPRTIRKEGEKSHYIFVDDKGQDHEITLTYTIPQEKLKGRWILVIDDLHVLLAMPKMD